MGRDLATVNCLGLGEGYVSAHSLFSFSNYIAECQLCFCSVVVGKLTSWCPVFPSTEMGIMALLLRISRRGCGDGLS